LISLDLSNFIVKSSANVSYTFDGINPNLIYCIDETKTNGKLSSQLSEFTQMCSCFQNSYNFVEEKNVILCIDNCSKEPNYQFKFKNCNNSCPNGTPSSNNYFCKIKCESYELLYNLCENNNNNNINNWNNRQNKNQLTKKIKKEIQEGLIDLLFSNVIDKEKKDIIINENGIIYQITSTENQKNNENNNISTIKLGACENTLRQIYGIEGNQSIYMLKVDYFREDLLIPIIGYELFHPENKSQLNLNLCKNSIINLNIPVDIDEDNAFLHDPKSDHYTDICAPYTTKNGQIF
jgi:hypothetical protein